MKVSKLIEQLDVKQCNAPDDLQISSLCYDSRKATPGCAFVAIKGYLSDGHDYIEKAVTAGAVLVIAQQKPKIDVPYIIVENSRLALALASREFFGHPQRDMTMIGVTGTNGKTTTTSLIKSALESRGEKCGLIGTNGSMIGDAEIEGERTTPESHELYALLDQMRAHGCKHVIMEVSAHGLTLDRVSGLHFEVGVFTNLSRDHLDFYPDMESYFAAKAKLLNMCKTAVVNIDDSYFSEMAEGISGEKITFGVNKQRADLVAKNIKLRADRVEFEALTDSGMTHTRLNIPGMFSVYNALAATATLTALGINPREVAQALSQASGVKGRAEVVPTNTDYTVIIDYAHTPDAIDNILTTVRAFTKGRVISLCGAGGDRDKSKRPLMGKACASLSDVCIITSDNPRSEDPAQIAEQVLEGAKTQKSKTEVILDRRQAICHALDIARAGDTVMVLGKGHETYQEINGQKLPLDERVVIAEHLKL